ncbi:DEAD/DEAH box helicase [Polystyrenella longa]|uniref:DEAD/DEAH box helicase n=1 Tax=Polystyrenella longa TaxID=2528007 RepID=UPI001E2C4861|nr:DEAD/DEAH box helicase [Polystyrenella longa]
MTESTKSFSDLKLRKAILKSLEQEGYDVPTPIQAESIPHIINGHDLIGCAQTGTGKTAAFSLPILSFLDEDRRSAKPNCPRVLILSPTRELAIQIGESIQTYGRNMKFRHAVIYGGVSQHRQTKALNRGVHLLVATPGRLLDLMNQGFIHLNELEIFVLDEADRMLDMGFLPDLKKIIKTLPDERQSLFFSATMPQKVSQLANSLLVDPIRVEVSPNSSTVENIKQVAYMVPKNKKRDLLLQLLEDSNFGSAIIFTRTKRGADLLATKLHQGKIKAEAIHGNKSQAARQRILNGFKTGKTHILVATDLAARGIDVDGITHVINFDMPQEAEDYVHRIGRTGRAGATGIAVTFCEPGQKRGLRDIERLTESQIEILTNTFQPLQGGANDQDTRTEDELRDPRPQQRRKFQRKEGPTSSPSGERKFKGRPGRKKFNKSSSESSESSFGKPRTKKPFKGKPKRKPKPARRPGK